VDDLLAAGLQLSTALAFLLETLNAKKATGKRRSPKKGGIFIPKLQGPAG